jgi:hypothetical protein
MSSPISARIADRLRQDLARYCVEHGVSQTDAIAAGLDLLLARPTPDSPLTPEQAAAGLALLERDLAARLAGFDAEAAEEEGRD